MTVYRGMRWLKCDLQMQTPADAKHWMGDRLVPGQESAAAKEFAKACCQQKLDVVGITDHNFLSKDFMPYLKLAFEEIEREFNHKITMFPGFEFEAAGVGRGVHILCLFEPDSDLATIDSILTECGIRYPRTSDAGQLEKSDKNLKDILRIVQNKYAGIVIMPHATSSDGIFDDETISEWLQQDQFTNPDLLAVEIPKPVHMMSGGYRRLLRSGDDCQQGWRRIRPIATLMSSDNKKLIDIDEYQRPSPNSIGYRYSWIKMSVPSVESLRQAFLDHESRIILPEDVSVDIHPADRSGHAKIQSILVRSVAFLADQEVHFSPNMNCVIGGRGSGKSTLLEYMRIIFGKDKTDDLDRGSEERIERVRDTLNKSGAELHVNWISAEGIEDQIIWNHGSPAVQNRELDDPETFFNNLPIRFYSQQQLNRLTESRADGDGVRQAQRLLELVDGFAKSELSDLADREHSLKLKIQDSFVNLRRAKALGKDLKRLQQEYQELDRQWKARSEIQDDARRHQQLKLESRHLDDIYGKPREQFSDAAVLAETLAGAHVPFQSENAPHADWFRQFDEKVKAAKEALARSIRDSVEQFGSMIESLKTNDPAWEQIKHDLSQADEKFEEACRAKGLTTDDVGRLQETDKLRTKKQREIDDIKAKIERLIDEAGDAEALMGQLHQIWRDQFQKRIDAARQANEMAVFKDSGQKFIEVSAKYQQDYQNFYELWQTFAPDDGRTSLGRNWQNLGKQLLDRFVEEEKSESPWETYRQLFFAENGQGASDTFGNLSEQLKQHTIDSIEAWENLRCSRVRDTVDMELFRHDGTKAGSIANGSLSDGQRNTAALALLLAQKGGPLVIDQPEDELDSNFVFQELIPILRKVKSKRQLIIATHNANLPVNGDAELIYAFEARAGKGEVLAQGGLDQKAVTKSVLDIMEGTEEAFRRRREKYHF